MKVTVKPLKGPEEIIEVNKMVYYKVICLQIKDGSVTINELRQLYEQRSGVAANSYRMLFKGKNLAGQ